MTKEEAIKEIKSWDFLEGKEIEAIHTLIPELAESEDERIRKLVVNRVRTATEMTESLRELLLSYLEKQKELPTNEEMLRTLRVEYEKGVADTIAKYEQKEQKPAEWSKEDEEALREVKLNFELNHEDMTPALVEAYERFFNKLKFFHPQPKPEWSEDDERIMGRIQMILEFFDRNYHADMSIGSEVPKYIAWLNSPKNRGNFPRSNTNSPSWKPSEEQMKEYRYWYRNFIESGLASPSSKAVTVLGELLEQLEKL